MTTQTQNASNAGLRWLIVGLLTAVAFLSAYRYAQAAGASTTTTSGIASATGGATGNSVAGVGGGGCCGGGASGGGCGSGKPTANGVTGAEVPGTAALDGGVQKITVNVTGGTYSPNVVKLKAGVPAQITFTQASGCTGTVTSPELGFTEDLSSGAKTVSLPALSAGTYSFTCGMSMVYGKIVVE